MTHDIVFWHASLILDACCAINLALSGIMPLILQALPVPVTVAKFVLDEELVSINLHGAIAQGLIRVVSPESVVEEEAVVNFAAELDDGEAVTGAIAIHRHWSIATDDGKARRVFARTHPQIQLLSTPEILKYWVDAQHPPCDVVRAALQSIQSQARYRPSTTHRLHPWWQAIVDRP